MTNACVVLDLPYFYIIGGRTITGLTYDFWQYDFTDNQFYLIRLTDVYTDISLFKHTCSLSIEDGKKYIYVLFGSQSLDDNPYCGITKFDIDDLTNVTIKIISTHVTEFTCRTESALLFFGGVLYVYGGQSFGKYVFDDAFIISVNPYDEMELYYFFDIPLYSFTYAQFSNFFIFFSGLETAYFPQIKPSSSMIIENAIKLNDSICFSGFHYNESLN